MAINIVSSSPAAQELAKHPETASSRTTYPFKALDVGQSFVLPLATAKLSSLRVIAARRSIEGKKFTVIEHADQTPPVVEVARIA